MGNFRSHGDGCTLTIPESNVELTIDRLRWDRDELKGELAIHCGIVGGKAIDGCLTRGTYNVSSQRARDEQAKFLIRRSRSNELPWLDWLEEFSQRTLQAYRAGAPAVLLRSVPTPTADDEYNVDGWLLPKDDPTIAFGDAEGGKSLLALYAAGKLQQQGVNTLLADFEWNPGPHKARLAGFFGDDMPAVHYVKCDRPLVYEIDRLKRLIADLQIRFAVFDSVGYACAGPPEQAEHALAYFRALRQLPIGGLHLAHINKTEGSDQKPFGSTFWHASARSTWFVKRTNPDTAGPSAPVTVGLYHRKSNGGARRPAIGFQFAFTSDRVDVSRVDLAGVDELGSRLPLWQRMKALLRNGSLAVPTIAEQLEVPEASVRQALKRDADRAGRNGNVSMFTRVDGGFIGLLERRSA